MSAFFVISFRRARATFIGKTISPQKHHDFNFSMGVLNLQSEIFAGW